jgi:hypothetical protein
MSRDCISPSARTRLAVFPRIALISIPLFLAHASVFAEPSRFRHEELRTVSTATDLVTEPHHKQFVLGEQLVLTRRDSKAAREVRASGLQARIFTLAAGKEEPSPWAEFDPCLVYLSAVATIPPVNEAAINLGALIGEEWLTAVKGRAIDIGRFLLVFEKSTDGAKLLRLEKGSKSAYFKSGLYFEVRPSSFKNYSQAEVDALASANERREPEIRNAARINSNARPCYSFEIIRVATGGEQLAYLGDCVADEALP